MSVALPLCPTLRPLVLLESARGARGPSEGLALSQHQAKEVPMRRVFVRAYQRWRLGRLESVCQHTRRWPRQYSFNF